MEKNSYIKCIILKNDLKVDIIEDVRIITLKSSNDTLIIMKDYWPVVGEFYGKIVLEKENDSIVFENINCFYCLSSNVFRLIMKVDKNES